MRLGNRGYLKGKIERSSLRGLLVAGLFCTAGAAYVAAENGDVWASGSMSTASKTGKVTVKFRVHNGPENKFENVKVELPVTAGTSGNNKAHALAEAINTSPKGIAKPSGYISAASNANTISIVSTVSGGGVVTTPKVSDTTGQKTRFGKKPNAGSDAPTPFAARPLDSEEIFVTFTGWPTGISNTNQPSTYSIATAQLTASHSPSSEDDMVDVMTSLRDQLSAGGVGVSHVAPNTLRVQMVWAADKWIEVGTDDSGSDWFTSGWDD